MTQDGRLSTCGTCGGTAVYGSFTNPTGWAHVSPPLRDHPVDPDDSATARPDRDEPVQTVQELTVRALECPLRPCLWRTPVHWQQRDQEGRLHVVQGQDELLAHLAAEHREELQLMLAGADGGRGVPVVCSITQHIDARSVQDAADLVVGVLVPQMRGQLARELMKRNLRPLDPWPAVTVRRLVWSSSDEWVNAMHNGTPSGMRELQDAEWAEGRKPDLYQLELRTDAVQDTRPGPQL